MGIQHMGLIVLILPMELEWDTVGILIMITGTAMGFMVTTGATTTGATITAAVTTGITTMAALVTTIEYILLILKRPCYICW